MQHLGNTQNALNEKSVIGGKYSLYEKSLRMDEENHSSVCSQSIPYVDSLDDILCSSPENDTDDKYDYAQNHRKFHYGPESYEDYEEDMQDFESDAGVDEDEQYSKGEVDDTKEDIQRFEPGEDIIIKESNVDDDDMDEFFKDIERTRDDYEHDHDYEPKDRHRSNYDSSSNCGGISSRVNTILMTPTSPKIPSASPKKVTFSEIFEPVRETVIAPRSRSMMRALEGISALSKKQSPVATSKVRKASTPYYKPASRNSLKLPRSPPMRTPPRANRSHNPNSFPSGVAKIRSPIRSSPTKSPKKKDRSDPLLSSKPSSTPPKVGIKKNKRTSTISEAPHLHTMAKLGSRNYSSTTPETLRSPKRGHGSQVPYNKLRKTVTTAEMKNMLCEDFRRTSPMQERFVPRTTVPKPFSFFTEERAAFRRLAHPVVEDDHGHDNYRPFKALSIPNYDSDPLFLGIARSPMGKFQTIPEPFQLSVCRGVYLKKVQKVQDDGEIGRYRFKALPVPDFSYKPKGCEHEVNLTVPFPFYLRIDERFANRIRFHGTKRSNFLANVHVACLIEKARSADAMEKKETKAPDVSSVAPISNLRPPTTPRRLGNGIKPKKVTRTFKDLPLPKCSIPLSPRIRSSNMKNINNRSESPDLRGRSKSRVAPYSSVSLSPQKKSSSNPTSSAKNRSGLTISTSLSPFKAKRMPNFSRPFSPVKKPPSPANSTNSTRSFSSSPSFKAKRIPNFLKPFSPVKKPPSPANSTNSTESTRAFLSSPSFKAKVMPNFSRPFSPIKKPPRPASSTNTTRSFSSSPSFKAKRIPNFTRPFSPIKKLSNVASSASIIRSLAPASVYDGRKTPDFSRPFSPITKPPSPGNSINAMQHLSSKTSVVNGFSNNSTTSTPEGSVSTHASNFEAKKMPDFSKPSFTSKMSPRPEKSAPSTASSRSQIVSVNPMGDYFDSETRQDHNRLPPTIKRIENEFKARPMPNFSKPFLPVKKTVVEEALLKAAEDKDILDILNQKLNAYKEKLKADVFNESNDKDTQKRLNDMIDKVVHKALQDFVNTAKSTGVDVGFEALNMDFSVESSSNPSQDFSYGAISSISGSLSHERVDQHLSESTLEESDISLASQSSSAEVSLSYSTLEMKQRNSEENIDSVERIRSELEEIESGSTIASAIDRDNENRSTKDCVLRPVHSPLSPTVCDWKQHAQEVQEEEQLASQVSSYTVVDEGLSQHLNADAVGNKSDGANTSLRIKTGLPPLHMKPSYTKRQEISDVRTISIVDEKSDNSVESYSTDAADVSEAAMPLLRIANRLNETMQKLKFLEKKNERAVSNDPSPNPDNTTMKKDSDKVVSQYPLPILDNITMETCHGENTVNRNSDTNIREAKLAHSLVVDTQCERIEVDNGDHCVEIRSPRGQFGDDFGSDTDKFRAGWKRALQHADLRDSPENCIDETISSKMASLSMINEELVSEQSDQHDNYDLLSTKVQSIAGLGCERKSANSVMNFATKPDENTMKVNSKSSFFDTLINCCSGKTALSPRSEELQLLEDARDEYEN